MNDDNMKQVVADCKNCNEIIELKGIEGNIEDFSAIDKDSSVAKAITEIPVRCLNCQEVNYFETKDLRLAR